MPSTSISAPLLPSSAVVYRAYPLRWYIAAVFVVFCVMQSAMWSFYAPISGPLMQLYGWSPYFIEWLGNTANIVFCVLVVPLGLWVDGRGMRVPMIVTIFALCINSGLRCLPREALGPAGFSSASMAAMTFNGIAGTVETLSPPVLSALWFPAHERATATALMATANTLGTCVGFLTAFVVPPALANDCSYLSLPANCSDPPPPPPDALAASNAQIDRALTTVYFTYFAVCAVAFVFVLFRFPDRPPVPPSASCALARDLSLLSGLRALGRNATFWLAVACMSIPLGVYSAWLNVLNINLQSFSFSQQDSGWVGFGSALAGAIGGLLSGFVADKLPKNLTRLIAGLYLCSGAAMLWFTLICFQVLPYSLPAVYVSSISVGLFMYGTYPLFFELIMEIVFPVPEACASAVLVMTQAVVQAVFLAVPVDIVGYSWMNYALCICPAACALVLMSLKLSYNRLQLDQAKQPPPNRLASTSTETTFSLSGADY